MRRIRRGQGTPREDWQAQFAASLANAGLAPLTVRAYRHDVDLFLKWFAAIKGGEPKLAELTTADVLSYRQHLVNVARLRASTINQRLQALRCLCRWAERQGLLKANPAAGVKALRLTRRRQPAGLTEPEVHGLLRVAGESKRGQAKRNYALLRSLRLERVDVSGLSRELTLQLATLVRRYDAWTLKRFAEPKRHAMLACFLTEAQKTVLDHLAEMHDRLLTRIWGRSQRAFEERHRELRHRAKEGVDQLVVAAVEFLLGPYPLSRSGFKEPRRSGWNHDSGVRR